MNLVNIYGAQRIVFGKVSEDELAFIERNDARVSWWIEELIDQGFDWNCELKVKEGELFLLGNFNDIPKEYPVLKIKGV